jgi:hypothetical protein
VRLQYSDIEEEIAAALPELRPAADRYWREEGRPGEDSGPYIFFEDMFARYVEILLALPRSGKRDAALSRAFAFVEEMLTRGDSQVKDLAMIGLYEGRSTSWFAAAAEFIGPAAAAQLDAHEPGWRDRQSASDSDERTEMIDLYGVRAVIADHLSSEGISINDVPGITSGEDVSSSPRQPNSA